MNFAVFLTSIAIILLVVWLNRRHEADDLAAGVVLGPESQLSAPAPCQVPDLIASQCAQCRSVRCVDQRWQPAGMVPLPVGCRVSHGLCPVCERAAHAAADQFFTDRDAQLRPIANA